MVHGNLKRIRHNEVHLILVNFAKIFVIELRVCLLKVTGFHHFFSVQTRTRGYSRQDWLNMRVTSSDDSRLGSVY